MKGVCELKKESILKLLAIGAAAGTAAAIGTVAVKRHKKKKIQRMLITEQASSLKRKAYFIGGGLESLAGAVYLMRDCNFLGENIYIIEPSAVVGGEYYAAGNPDTGYIIRNGAELFSTDANLWDLLDSVPSLRAPDISVSEDVLTYNSAHPTAMRTRIIDADGIAALTSLGLDKESRRALLNLLTKNENSVTGTIAEWFAEVPQFLDTKLWVLLSTDFKLCRESSALVLRAAVLCHLSHIAALDSRADIIRTPLNTYESVILPIKAYLERMGVKLMSKCRMTGFNMDGGFVTELNLDDNGARKTIYLEQDDLCFISCGSIADGALCGDIDTPPPAFDGASESLHILHLLERNLPDSTGAAELFSHPEITTAAEFTVTTSSNLLLRLFEEYTKTPLGADAFITATESPWCISIDIGTQPVMQNQSGKTTVLHGFALCPSNIGIFTGKPMHECSGREVVYELISALHMQRHWEEIDSELVNSVVCIEPFALAPTLSGNRPAVNGGNLAVIGRFSHAGGSACSAEYAVRSARTAAYELTRCGRKIIPPVKSAGPVAYARAIKKMGR